MGERERDVSTVRLTAIANCGGDAVMIMTAKTNCLRILSHGEGEDV